jgi:hypothetical protein
MSLKGLVRSRPSIAPSGKGDSHARRTPKKKAFSQLREKTMVCTPPRNSVFASIPRRDLRLTASSVGLVAPFVPSRRGRNFSGRGFFV